MTADQHKTKGQDGGRSSRTGRATGGLPQQQLQGNESGMTESQSSDA